MVQQLGAAPEASFSVLSEVDAFAYSRGGLALMTESAEHVASIGLHGLKWHEYTRSEWPSSFCISSAEPCTCSAET